MNMNFTVRQGIESDSETLIEFNRAMARETEDRELPLNLIKPGVESFLKHREYGFYVIAEKDSEIVGSLMITFEWSDWRNGLFWWIQSVYVKPEFRRQGVYSSMHNYVRELAKEKGNIVGLRLYAERNNETAHKTYESNNMHKTIYIMYEQEI